MSECMAIDVHGNLIPFSQICDAWGTLKNKRLFLATQTKEKVGIVSYLSNLDKQGPWGFHCYGHHGMLQSWIHRPHVSKTRLGALFYLAERAFLDDFFFLTGSLGASLWSSASRPSSFSHSFKSSSLRLSSDQQEQINQALEASRTLPVNKPRENNAVLLMPVAHRQ